MAPEPPSPSASSILLPLLGGTSPRRSSLVSITSRKEIDKDALSQTLDHIHITASKSETLTSFHDYDGRAPGSKSGPKDLVSNGVSGLYNRLKQSVGGGSPVKENKQRPNSSSSVSTTQSTAPVMSAVPLDRGDGRLARGSKPQQIAKPANVPSAVTEAKVKSPLTPAFEAMAQDIVPSSKGNAPDRADTQQPLAAQRDGGGASADETTSGDVRLSQDLAASSDRDRVRDAVLNDDRSESATHALARVLSHHEPQSAQVKTSIPGMLFTSDVDRDGNVSDKPDESNGGVPNTLSVTNAFSANERRPPMIRVGVSHLPGFDPSRTPSPSRVPDVSSSNSSQIERSAPSLEPSANLNTGLQRKRTGPKSHAAPNGVQPIVPANLRRRVISKEFWMKDINAKVCFNCGEGFSTFRRKHHCRTCGQIFDAKCTSLVEGRPFGQPGTLRLCKPCEEIILGDADDDSSELSEDGNESMRTPIARRSAMTEGMSPTQLDGMTHSLPDGKGMATPSIGIPASRRNREAKRRSAVIEFDTHPSLARPSSSRSLMSLAARPRSSSHRRHNSRHQLMRANDDRAPFHQDAAGDPEKRAPLPAFHNDNIIDPDLAPYLSDEDSEGEGEPQSLFAAMASDGRGTSPADNDKHGLGGFFAAAVRRSKSKLGDRGTATSSVKGIRDDDNASVSNKHGPRLHKRRNPSISSINMQRPSPRHSRSKTLLRTMEHEPQEDPPPSPIHGPSSIGSRFVRSSAMHGKGAPPVELNQASLDHVRKLLGQLLHDAKVHNASAWQQALVPVLLQCTDDVEPDVQRGDDMDIRHYIKLKKIAGGRTGDTSYVSGVVFSKNIALKSMARSIAQPRIAIVTFAIEYARHQAHFMSLEPVIAQEREYLHVLVGRIAALHPQLLLVQRNVSGLALELLEKAGITVAFNIKESVLAAVARMTQTTMIRSVDKLAINPSHLGRCESFDVKTYVHQGLRKSYIVLSGCSPDLGCTIVLRGADIKVLRTVKRIAEFMCFVVYNLKLETYLMRDQFVSVPATRPQQLEDANRAGIGHAADDQIKHITNGHDLSEAQADDSVPSKYGKIEQETRSRILSASPFVVFMQPIMLTQLRDHEAKLAYSKKLRDHYGSALEAMDNATSTDVLDERFELVKPEMVHAAEIDNQSRAVREYLHAVHSAQFDRTMATYETQRKLWETFTSTVINPYDPYAHQTIVMLHSTVSSLTSAPCIGPDLLGLGFYAGYNKTQPTFEEDCTIGQYVEDLCLTAGQTCKVCERKTYDHHRQYVHGYGQLSISVQRQPARLRGYSNSILMWSTCRICQAETTIVQMSENTWKYSFAKYLELSFWSSPLHPRAGVCNHDIHKDFFRCFGFQDLMVRVQYDAIDIYDVVVPKPIITWKVEEDLTVKNEQYTYFEARLTAFVDSIRKRLSSINVDTLDEKQMMEALEMIEKLRKRAEDDHRDLLLKLQTKYGASRYYELIPLNRALRYMDEKAIAWDQAFNDFERDYFPSENDIRKLAAAQLKEMFYGSHSSADSVASDVSDNEGTEMTAMPAKSLGQRVADEEVHDEKAHGAMTSVAQEHRPSLDDGEGHVHVDEEPSALIGAQLTRKLSPREEQEQAVDRNEVRHLDLAVAARSPEDDSSDARHELEEQLAESTISESSESTPQESFATQPKPLSTGLLQRIEQIRSNRVSDLESTEPPESKIPRLVELKKRDAPITGSVPPLIRAQSQPAHVPRRNLAPPNEHSDVIPSPSPAVENQSLERRLGDRLNQLGKVGKMPPSLIPRSIPTKEHSVPSSVSALAKHFEQMSREFEKERLKERRQRAAKSRQARANPLASSRPVVEVYESATDAVGERATFGEDMRADAAAGSTQPVSVIDHAVASEELQPSDAMQSSNEIMPTATSGEDPVTTDTDNESIDATDTTTRSRDTSDPPSHISGSTLISPSAQELEFPAGIDIPEHKKNVWFKMLADFWSKRSASGWTNLEYPLHNTEHVFEDSDIIVREDEPSSVIALSLACADYQVKVKQFRSSPKKDARKRKAASRSYDEVSPHDEEHVRDIEASLLSDTGTHMKYTFAHGSVKASCKIFYAESFDALRRRCGVSTRFVESLSRCLKFDSKGGKTKSLFLKTLDNRFIIKSLQEVELKAFTKFAPDYFAFMSYTLFHGVPSVIAKMFGLFQVTIKNPATGMDFSYYLLVMENLFYEHTPNRRFDLKGSMRNRKISPTGLPDEVLLDENLVETIFERPLFIHAGSHRLLHASVWNDTLWLCKQNVMDYSLMAGFDDASKTLVVGIIDCIRTYTWDKKLESWIKDRGKNKPTITSPKDYRNRFRVSMMQYVLQAPNCWFPFLGQIGAPKRLGDGGGLDEGGE
nr:hypothetical protein B0A51_03746 [Rachicladosporium sp. CCFEE 5018]